MKHISYTFTDSDIKTCLFALSQLNLLHQDDDVSEIQIAINEACAASAVKKLSLGMPLTENELRVLCCCITYCNLICQGSITASPQIYKECMRYTFSLNKLDEKLSSQIL